MIGFVSNPVMARLDSVMARLDPVMAGLDPAIPTRTELAKDALDGRVKHGQQHMQYVNSQGRLGVTRI
jgi:hypothetical protein